MSRRAGFSSASLLPVMVSPRKRIVPDVGSSSARIMRASVDLPQPERPTSATDWPGVMREGDVVDGADRGGAFEQRCAPAGIVARHACRPRSSGWPLPTACDLGARRHMHRGLRQLARVGVQLFGQRARGVAGLHHLAMAQDGDAVGHLGDHRQVVRDQQQAHAVFRDQIAQQVEDLRLQHHVERRRRLVGDQQLGFQRTGDGDDDALALAAGQFVRIARQREFRLRQADAVEHFSRPFLGVGAARLGVPAYALGDLLADGLDRVERRHRLLEHHADVVAAQRAHLVFGGRKDVDAVEGDAAGGARRMRQKLHDGQRRHRLAGAGFADQPHHFAGRDGQLDVLQDRRVADRQRQVLDLEQAHRCRREFRIEDVGDAVAEQVEAEHGDDDRHAGEDRRSTAPPPCGSARRTACGPSSALAAARRGRHRKARPRPGCRARTGWCLAPAAGGDVGQDVFDA